MLRDLTVKQILHMSAELRLPSEWNHSQKMRFSNSVINLLSLHEIRHSRIGDEETRGISGGQRKRVNVGIELVADPTVLFLDEPTSGLILLSMKKIIISLKKNYLLKKKIFRSRLQFIKGTLRGTQTNI